MSECAPPITDPRIEALPAVLNTQAFAEHLRGFAITEGDDAEVKEVRIEGVLRHHVGKRCALEIKVRTGGGWHSLIAKIYHKDRSEIFQAMKGIEQAGFGPKEEFSIPRPVAYVASLNCILLEKVEGLRVEEVFKSGDDQMRAAAAKRCALWLARFHALAPKLGTVLYPYDLLNSKSMQRYSIEIAKQGGRCAYKAASLLQRLEESLAFLSPLKSCAGHGSFSASHVILAQGRTVVFDWDGYDVADPARDVGRFLGALRRSGLGRRLGSINALDETGEIFLRSYLAAGQPNVERNLHFFLAASCLNLAKHTLCRPVLSPQKNRAKAEALLDEGFAILDGVTV